MCIMLTAIPCSRTQNHKVPCHPKSIQSSNIYGQIEHYIISLCRSVGGHQWNAAGESRGRGPWLSSWKINRVSLLQFQISCTHFPHSSSSHKPSGSVVDNCILCLRGHRLHLDEGCTDIKILSKYQISWSLLSCYCQYNQ